MLNLRQIERRVQELERAHAQLIAKRKTDFVWSYLLPKYLRLKAEYPGRELPPFIDLVERTAKHFNPYYLKHKGSEEERLQKELGKLRTEKGRRRLLRQSQSGRF